MFLLKKVRGMIQHATIFIQGKARGAQNRSVVVLREDSSTTATQPWRKRGA